MNIAILYTGGTIGCVGDPLSPLGEEEFKGAFDLHITPILKTQYADCSIAFIPFGPSLDSTNLQPSDWCKMASDILNQYSQHDAFIVLHGTDTMAWSASALSFLLTGLDGEGNQTAVLNKPIIVTGSQLPLFYRSKNEKTLSLRYNTDAYQNVCGAIAAAYTGLPEACLYFNNHLYRGNRTIKTNASEFDAFSSPNYPSLGESGIEFSLANSILLPAPVTASVSLETPSVQTALKAQLSYVSEHIDESRIMPFLAYPAYYTTGIDPTSVLADQLKACIDKGLDGLILESYGEGNFPSGDPDHPTQGKIYKVLDEATKAGLILINCTQVLHGTVNSNAYAAGSWMASVGAVGTFDMIAVASLAKLVCLMALKDYKGYDWDKSMIEQLMLTNLAGEIEEVNILDSRGLSPFLMPGQSISALDGSATLLNDVVSGPILTDNATGETLWTAIPSPVSTEMPGRFIMQSDGNLVFYTSSNMATYASDTVQTAPATSRLVLGGSVSANNLKLYIDYYAENSVTKVLYPS